jgi:hypothetical protein
MSQFIPKKSPRVVNEGHGIKSPLWALMADLPVVGLLTYCCSKDNTQHNGGSRRAEVEHTIPILPDRLVKCQTSHGVCLC